MATNFVVKRGNKDFEKMMKIFKFKERKSGIMYDIKSHQYYIPKTEKKKIKIHNNETRKRNFEKMIEYKKKRNQKYKNIIRTSN